MLPSALWRSAVGLGVDLGWSDRQLESQDIPGTGTIYVITLSAVSIGAAALTVALVRSNGARLPSSVPTAGSHQLPVAVVVGVSLAGAAVVAWICVMGVRNWSDVSGFADQPDSAWSTVMAACYAPALLWSPFLVAVTVDHWRRRRRRHRDESATEPSSTVRPHHHAKETSQCSTP
ncbi:MAG: hypothetical protein ACRDZ2_10090 [Ilumatobacteraceae bacterium]